MIERMWAMFMAGSVSGRSVGETVLTQGSISYDRRTTGVMIFG